MTASTTPKTIHGASTIRSVRVIRISPLTGQCCHYQCTRRLCGSSEADMVTVWRRCGGPGVRARRRDAEALPGGDSMPGRGAVTFSGGAARPASRESCRRVRAIRRSHW
jgi:hypothetical protein